ncbi:hypothetical protein TUM16656_28820 [Klebsiella pneumoniae]|nr:hypothetical protein TUM16656_28820 [Klebsiella pneumoniae]GJK24563.1 hypothetical protein TUM17555_22380 [Klebsiella pneumoniae]GJK81075.1 hypothetical protein TUM17566_31270 [Klebsiella pneumoniae]
MPSIQIILTFITISNVLAPGRFLYFEVDMSGIITLVIALILLVAAVYNLISYIRDRRSASLPSKKTKR